MLSQTDCSKAAECVSVKGKQGKAMGLRFTEIIVVLSDLMTIVESTCKAAYVSNVCCVIARLEKVAILRGCCHATIASHSVKN